MKCVMSRGIYLRADGRLPCYCGAGETLTLGIVPLDHTLRDFTEDFYRQGLFQKIRAKMAHNVVPFPGICDQCTYLDLDSQFEPDLVDSEVEWFHWEPSSHCNLDCQWCTVHRKMFNESHQNRLLPLDTFKRIVKSLADHQLKLKMGNICGVGEPTLNPDIWEMIGFANAQLGGDILLSTNGNGPYSSDIVSCGLNKIKIAVDAIDQTTYERYRKKGNLAKAIRFTQKIALEKARRNLDKPIIIWQYILFNYNDSDRDLITYQRLAEDNGVDQLRIVYTRCNNYSTRSPADFPEQFPNIIYLPIGSESLLDIDDAQREFSAIDELVQDQELNQAVIASIRLVNKLYHRLALGVATYADLLKFTSSIYHLQTENLATLTPSQYHTFTHLIEMGFARLGELHHQLGNEDQARQYQNYLERILIKN